MRKSKEEKPIVETRGTVTLLDGSGNPTKVRTYISLPQRKEIIQEWLNMYRLYDRKYGILISPKTGIY